MPALCISLDGTMRESLLTRFNEYFRMELRMGSMMNPPVSATRPPITTSSGLKMLISPAMYLPSVYPHLFHDLDAEGILHVGGLDNIGQRELL